MDASHEAIQRLREALNYDKWSVTVLAYRADLHAALDALDATDDRIAGLELEKALLQHDYEQAMKAANTYAALLKVHDAAQRGHVAAQRTDGGDDA